ncbi:MAG: glycosyl hydrolase family 28 protein [Planctomycetota bacterium]|nr:glycosyl hydrolase family 28 protein [Planctomycetota bacterium]
MPGTLHTLIVVALVLSSGTFFVVAADAPAQKLVIYPAPAGEKPSGDFSVEVNGQAVFVYTANVLHGGPASFAYFDCAGTVNVKVTATRKVDKAVVRPSSYGITPAVVGNTVAFALSQPRYLSIELNGGFERPLLLFANPLEVDPPRPDDPNVLYFGPGVHEIGTTKIESNKTVYIAAGAIVRGKIMPGEKPIQERNWAGNKVYTNLLCIENAKNVKVRGRGILDMSTLPWHSKCPICISNCTDVLIEGIIIKDSPCWCTPVFGCKNVVYRNLKEICHRENSDGINIVNSQDVLVENCFLRNNDDEICIKTTSPAPAQESKNITVRNCVVWNDRAYAIGVTYETRQNISEALFKDCDIIHDHGIGSIAIHMSDGATVSGIRFEDVRVEDTRNRLIRFWIGKDFWGHDKERGRLRGVVLKNVAVTGGPFASSELTGADPAHLIEDVTFDNLRIHGKLIANAAAGKIAVNQHTKNIKFVSDTTPPADAPKINEIKAVPGDPQIVLSWSKVEDPESGVDHYNVYRDDRKIGEAREASYADRDVREEMAYTYCVAAVNGADLEGPKSAPGQARTLADTGAPAVAAVDVDDLTHIKVVFSEPVEQPSAEAVANYALDNDASVTAAALSADLKTVTLTISKLAADKPYALTVRSIKDRARTANVIAAGTVAKFMYSAGLIGHWKLDDGHGDTAADSSRTGAHGKLVNMDAAKCWVEGKLGRGLEFDGENSHVELANSPALQNVQEGSYTLCAWFRPASTPPGTGNAYNAAYGIIMKKGYHEGLTYAADGKFVLSHWLAGDKGGGAATAGAYPPGQFHHVAGVVDKAKGEARIYVNGKLEGSSSFDANAQARPYGDEPWRIGAANPSTRDNHAWPAKGIIDDVRIYNRVLSDEEIRNLAGTK